MADTLTDMQEVFVPFSPPLMLLLRKAETIAPLVDAYGELVLPPALLCKHEKTNALLAPERKQGLPGYRC